MTLHNADIALYALLITLGVWSFIWLVVAVLRARTDKKRKYFWLTHTAWVLVNLLIVGFGVVTLSSATFDAEFVTSQRNLVAINALLDVGYMVISKIMQKSAKTSLQQVGLAVFIQGVFLLVLDTVFAVIFTLLLR